MYLGNFIALPVKPPGMVRVVAVDLGATNTRVGVLDNGGIMLEKIEAKTPTGGADPAILTGFLTDMIGRVCGTGALRGFSGIGLSVAGPVDIRRRILLNPPNLPFRDVPLPGSLEEQFGIPVRMVNDCHAGLIGELSYGVARGRKNVVYITISTGIGGGVLADGRILLGRDGNAAEIGHFHVDDTYNLVCGCGHSGHWEGYASGKYLPWFFAQWCHYHGKPHWGPDTAENIFHSAREGDDDVMRFLRDLARINARAVSDVIVAYDPELIVFDGSVIRSNADLLLPPIIDTVDRHLKVPDMLMTGLKGDAPLLGAGVIAQGYDTRYRDFLDLTGV
ncbi:MAG TPA: ROK family protein [Methanoregulaceae archaeon]|nr:ROK family protein [Methanoregulaceae archaeon]HPD10141.1 ROK family protein [Methanoregulaceae archaeon]HRT15147.1 ROK family protein [Methanoregulaceae archaeon]HRU30736.1 ROK family protein [Methanoregulaceae archaeon]